MSIISIPAFQSHDFSMVLLLTSVWHHDTECNSVRFPKNLDVALQLVRVPIPTERLSYTMAEVEKSFAPNTQNDTTLKEKAVSMPPFLGSDEDLEVTYGVNDKTLPQNLDFKLLPALA